MSVRLLFALPLALSAACASPPLDATVPAASMQDWAAQCEDWADWDKPGPPFRIHANTWYVGTCGITAILVTGEEGHVLLDGGTEAGGDHIAANIQALGVALPDVRILLHSHEHFDHVAGFAELQRRAGARLLASPAAAPVLASGVSAPDDPQDGMHDPFPAARVDGEVASGQPVRLGALALTPLATPGHTPGALSWQWESCDESGDCRTIVYADSLSPISRDGYRFGDHPAYVARFRAGLAALAGLDCDILLTPHPSASGLRERIEAGELAGDAPCRDYAASIGQRLDTRLAQETAQ